MSTIIFKHPALNKPLRVVGKMEVCGNCRGHGTAFRRDLDENRLVDLMEEDGDDEGLEDYRRGHFNEVCTECKGRNVVEVPDWEAFEKDHPKELKKINSYDADYYTHQADVAAERAYFGY